MVVWSVIILCLALIGIITNLLWGMPYKVSWNDVVIFLVALGILIRIRFKTKKAEKEKLQQKIIELNKGGGEEAV